MAALAEQASTETKTITDMPAEQTLVAGQFVRLISVGLLQSKNRKTGITLIDIKIGYKLGFIACAEGPMVGFREALREESTYTGYHAAEIYSPRRCAKEGHMLETITNEEAESLGLPPHGFDFDAKPPVIEVETPVTNPPQLRVVG